MKADFIAKMRTAAAMLPRALSDDGPFNTPPPGSDAGIGRLLWTMPRPLMIPRARLLFIYSWKAACTNIVVWYLRQLGHAQAARDFDPWPHTYLHRVFYFSDFYRKAYTRNFERFTVVRIVRDPFDRAVSSYRHALKHGHADADIARQLGYRDIGDKGLSFSAFLDFLERIDLTSCDRHFAQQRHPIEDSLKVDHLINITTDDLFQRLNRIAVKAGLKRIKMDDDPWLKRLHLHNRPEQTLEGADLDTRPLTREQAKFGPWPSAQALLTTQARERLARLYAVDIKAYLQAPPAP